MADNSSYCFDCVLIIGTKGIREHTKITDITPYFDGKGNFLYISYNLSIYGVPFIGCMFDKDIKYEDPGI